MANKGYVSAIAGTTKMTQACNAGAIVKGPKTTYKRISNADVITNFA